MMTRMYVYACKYNISLIHNTRILLFYRDFVLKRSDIFITNIYMILMNFDVRIIINTKLLMKIISQVI